MTDRTPLLSVRDLQVHFKVASDSPWPWAKPQLLKAVDGLSFDVFPGETLGIVGESGCGKSTLARAMLNLIPATAGSIIWQGQEMRGAGAPEWHALRKSVQMIFQDPLACLDPRMTVGQIIAQPLHTHLPQLPAQEVMQRVRAMMQKVGLTTQQINRYPHEFSGGQCQRIGIARALVLEPKLVICDEPVSALDVSIQSQILNLLQELRRELNLTMLFISHDLGVVRYMADRMVVMRRGQIVESGEAEQLFRHPGHPYTVELLAAIPKIARRGGEHS